MIDALGNDVVWLDDPKNRGRSADLALVNRILTAKERLLVSVTPDQDRMLWSLWAAKEAAFKAWSRSDPSMVFSPITFEVEFDPRSGAASVRKSGVDAVLKVRWVQGNGWIHALVSSRLESVIAAEDRYPSDLDESGAVRTLALRLLSDAGWGNGTIVGRPPRFYKDGGEAPVLVSLSHDGPWAAAAILPLLSR